MLPDPRPNTVLLDGIEVIATWLDPEPGYYLTKDNTIRQYGWNENQRVLILADRQKPELRDFIKKKYGNCIRGYYSISSQRLHSLEYFVY